MRVSQTELGLVELLIVYSAFFTHPAPRHLKDLLCSPVGKALGLLGVLYVAGYKSLIVGVFLAIALVLTMGSVTEYLDEKEQTPKKAEPEQPKSSTPKPSISKVLGDMRLPQTAGKDVKSKPLEAVKPKPALGKAVEHFASF